MRYKEVKFVTIPPVSRGTRRRLPLFVAAVEAWAP